MDRSPSAMPRPTSSTLFRLEFSAWRLNSVYLASVSENTLSVRRAEKPPVKIESRKREEIYFGLARFSSSVTESRV